MTKDAYVRQFFSVGVSTFVTTATSAPLLLSNKPSLNSLDGCRKDLAFLVNLKSCILHHIISVGRGFAANGECLY